MVAKMNSELAPMSAAFPRAAPPAGNSAQPTAKTSGIMTSVLRRKLIYEFYHAEAACTMAGTVCIAARPGEDCRFLCSEGVMPVSFSKALLKTDLGQGKHINALKSEVVTTIRRLTPGRIYINLTPTNNPKSKRARYPPCLFGAPCSCAILGEIRHRFCDTVTYKGWMAAKGKRSRRTPESWYLVLNPPKPLL